jgi:hypothetical protein
MTKENAFSGGLSTVLIPKYFYTKSYFSIIKPSGLGAMKNLALE